MVPEKLSESGKVSEGATASVSDEALMEGVRAGRAESLRVLLHRYWTPLVSYASGVVETADDAEDVVQETFVRIWRHRADWTPSGTVVAYFYRITRNLALNAKRDRLSHDDRGDSRLSSGFLHQAVPRTPEENFASEALRKELNNAINSLPDRRREIFVLSRFHGLTHGEIAETMGISPQTVSNQMSSALTDLRKALSHRLKE